MRYVKDKKKSNRGPISMWRIFHALFNWQYVVIENSAAAKIKRVWFSPLGKPMVSAYSFQIWELAPPFHGWKVTPLTPEVAEYLKTINTEPE